ncbi:MAG: ComEC/Rec2 family competence protein, partial [Anaerolineae bacterium]
ISINATTLVANALILPAQPPIMGLAAATAAAGSLSPVAGRLVGALAWLPLAYTIRVVEMASRWPGAGMALSLSAPAVAAYYTALAILSWPREMGVARQGLARRLRRLGRPGPATPGGSQGAGAFGRPGHRHWWPPTWPVLAAGAVITVVIWVAALTAPDGWLHVVFLDVGQGDAILVVTPTGRRLLVDAGPSSRAVLDGLGRRTPPWDRRLDAVVATHADTDHIGGMAEVLRRYDVGWILDSGMSGRASAAREYASVAAAAEGSRATVSAGERLVLDDRAMVVAEVLWPPADLEPAADNTANRHSVVTAIHYGRFTALLTADADVEVEATLVASGANLRVDVLKVGHHGSRTSTADGFLRAVVPAAAVISVGADNSFGHPTSATLRRLAGIPVWRTDRNGPVEVVSDGTSAWVRWDRGPGPPTEAQGPDRVGGQAPAVPRGPRTSRRGYR